MMTSTESESEILSKKPVKEIPVVQDQGYFEFPTGDTYNGFFEAKKKDKSCKMHGPGTYSTAEGDVYTGTWEYDKFGNYNEEMTVAYADGAKYEGPIRDWNYAGRGRYTYPDGSILTCDFVESCPAGTVMLKDPNGHIWTGKTELGCAWCQPVNHYYDILEKVREHNVVIKRRRTQPAKPLSAIASVKKVKIKT